MLTKIDLCAQALLKIGEKPIVSMSEESVAAVMAHAIFPGVVDGLVAMHPWNFARVSKRLIPVAGEDRKNCFLIPSDCLRIISVDETNNYEVMGANIFANTSSINLNYIRRVDVSDYPPYFQSIAVLKLACEFCLPLTENYNLYRTLVSLFEAELRQAKFIDSSQVSRDGGIHFSLLDVRY